MNGLLEYILLHHFGYIIIALSMLIASFIIKNKLAQLIMLLKTERTINPTIQPQNPHSTSPVDLPVLNLEPEKNEELSDEEFMETFGQPPLSEEPLEVQGPPKPSPPTQEESSLSQKLLKAARGDRK